MLQTRVGTARTMGRDVRCVSFGGTGEVWEMWDGVSVPLSLTVFPIGASLRITAGDTDHRKCRRDVLDQNFYIIYTIRN